jgi:hypothetical protein
MIMKPATDLALVEAQRKHLQELETEEEASEVRPLPRESGGAVSSLTVWKIALGVCLGQLMAGVIGATVWYVATH